MGPTKRLALFVFSLIALTTNATAAPSDLDPLFGNLGRVISSPDGTNASYGVAIALQTDGKIVMAGIPTPDNSGLLVARYNTNGSLDTTFNGTGWSLAPFPGQDFVHARAIDVQPDGKIVVGGAMGGVVDNVANWRFAIARFNTNGSLDTGFDGDGTLAVDFTPGFEQFRTIKALSDGKILVSGDAAFDTSTMFQYARLNVDGALDSTFGTGGKRSHLTNLTARDEIRDMVVLPDGTFVVAGFRINQFGAFRLAIKYNSTGTATEWTYLVGNPSPGAGGETLSGIAALPSGKLIVVGDRARKVVALRINANGTPDNSFLTPEMPMGYAKSVAIQSDGKIVSNIATALGSSFSLVRYNADGSLDSGFGINGIAALPGGDAQRALIQPDGKILLGGGVATGTPAQRYFEMVRYRGGNLISGKTLFDYDGDLKSDVSVYRPSNGVWYLNRSTAGFTAIQFGIASDRIVPADYDGDGKADIAIYRNGDWWILQSSNGTVRVVNFGIAEDKPQPGDFDGDGIDDQAVFRPSTGVWYIFRSTDSGYHAVGFGTSSDVPQRGDYDDDGKVDIAIFRPSDGTWYVQKSTGGYLIVPFGTSGDTPVANDYDGDSSPDFAVWRPSSGDWYLLNTSNGQIQRINFGVTGDLPVPADYDGDGKVDIAVFRPSTRVWYRIQSTNGQWASEVFGLGTDLPTPGAFTP